MLPADRVNAPQSLQCSFRRNLKHEVGHLRSPVHPLSNKDSQALTGDPTHHRIVVLRDFVLSASSSQLAKVRHRHRAVFQSTPDLFHHIAGKCRPDPLNLPNTMPKAEVDSLSFCRSALHSLWRAPNPACNRYNTNRLRAVFSFWDREHSDRTPTDRRSKTFPRCHVSIFSKNEVA